jgi:hypothetical protein
MAASDARSGSVEHVVVLFIIAPIPMKWSAAMPASKRRNELYNRPYSEAGDWNRAADACRCVCLWRHA